MKTLLIHPKDKTTDFLIESYQGLDYTILTTNYSNSGFKVLINEHDRIIMMGHGHEFGLLGHDKLMITSQHVYLLRNKPGSIYIWCNADKFVRKYALKGFATGMIISEPDEANLYCIQATDKEIQESNKLFALAVKESIMFPPQEMRKKMLEVYQLDNPIVYYNRQNFFVFE